MSALAALLFSLLAPGAGQILNGQYVKGIVIGVLFALGKSVLLPLLLRAFKVQSQRSVMSIFLWANRATIFLIFYAVVDGMYFSFFVPKLHWLTAIFCAFIFIAIYKNTFNEFFFTVLSGRTELYALLRPLRKLPTKKE